MKEISLDQRAYLASMRACSMRWRLRVEQVKNGEDWARSEMKSMLESAMWYRKHINQMV